MSGRPLLITDCDEVLLHMVRHFGAWLDEAHDIDFAPATQDFGTALRRRPAGEPVTGEAAWALLGGFFDDEMHRQTIVPGAIEALARIGAAADIVVLTNLDGCHHGGRVAQLAAHGIRHRVECNRGGKGRPVRRLVEEHGAPVTVFVDDLPVHHESVARHAPMVHRLHMVAEPSLAPHVAPAPAAHARIDDWAAAADWILARFGEGPASAGLTGRGDRALGSAT